MPAGRLPTSAPEASTGASEGASLGASLAAWIRLVPRPSRVALALTLVWALEVFLVQELTLVPGHRQSLASAGVYRVVRMLFDLLVCGALVCALPRRLLGILFLLNPVFYVVVILYHDYYQQPLSVHAILETSGEGVQVSGAVGGLLEAWHGLFIVLLLVKLALLVRGGSRVMWAERKRPTGMLVAAYGLLIVIANPVLQPLSKIGTWESVGGLGALYGYSLTWLAELAYLDVDGLRERALKRGVEAMPADVDRLLEEEASFPVAEKVVFLQVESLDLAVIDLRIDGREVSPNLNRLWRQSLRYAVQAPKGTGSSDADFRALMGKPPSRDVPTYKIPGYPYEGSFVERLKGRGFQAWALHGVTGEFFNRRPAYEKMPFDALVFREELIEERVSATEAWAIDDAELLGEAATRVGEAEGRVFALVITATSHIPFPLAPAERVFFPSDASPDFAYFDSIHYVDGVIGRFVEELPAGTTVVIYGDHISKIENPAVGYEQRLRDGEGCVPFLILETGADISALQRTGDELALSCELTSLHAFRFVQGRVEAAFAEEPPTVERAGSGGGEDGALSAQGRY